MNDNQTPLGPTDAQITRMRANVHRTITADQSATRRRRGWTIGGTLGLLVILAGGTSIAMAAGVLQAPSWFTAAPAPAPTVTHESVAVTTATPTVAPTPSATPTPPPAPAPFNLPCDQQFDPAVLASVAPGLTLQPLAFDYEVNPPAGHGITAAAVAPGQNLYPGSLFSDVAAAQTGFYSCEWSAPANPAIQTLRLGVLPGAAAQFAKAKSLSEAPDSGDTHLPAVSIGDDSFSQCDTEAIYACELDVLSGGMWFDVRARSSSGPAPAQQADALTALARSVISRVGAEGTPLEAAPAPASRWTGVTDCSSIQRGMATVVPGSQYEFSAGVDETDADKTPLFIEAIGLGDSFSCYSSAAEGNAPTVVVVPGAAAWAWDIPLAAAGADNPDSITVTPLPTAGIPGLDAARYACIPQQGCWADASIDGAMVTVQQGYEHRDATADTTLKELAAIAAATAK